MRTTFILPLLLGVATATGVAACGGSSTGPSGQPIVVPTAPNASNVSIVAGAATMGSGAFSPNPASASFAARPKIIWTNADREADSYGGTGTTHHLISDTGLFDSGTLSVGKSYSFTFAATGTYSYHCTLHPSMVGTITLTQ